MPTADLDLLELLVLDVDGVLTDGSIVLNTHGEELKAFHSHDGLGVKAWMRLGGHAAIITGRASMAVQHRANELGIRHVFQGVADKRAAFDELLADLDLDASCAVVVGDDLPDLSMMATAGYAIAVADAAAEVQTAAAFVTTRRGGRGAVREAVEHVLRARGRWKDVVALFHTHVDP